MTKTSLLDRGRHMTTKAAVGRRRRPRRRIEAASEDHRGYHRKSVRRLRAEPRRRHRQHQKSKRQYPLHKSEGMREHLKPPPDELVEQVCGLCGLRAAVSDIARLLMSDTTASGYIERRIPYCGQC